MRFLLGVFVFLCAIAAAQPADAASRGDILITVEIKDMGKLMSTFFEGFSGLAGEMSPEERARMKITMDEISAQPVAVSVGGKIFIQGNSLRLAINDFMGEMMGAAESVLVEVMVNEQDNYAYMWYPDTLNGMKFSMKGMSAEQMAGSGALIGNKDFSKVLQGANVKTIPAREILGLKATGYAVKLPAEGGQSIDLNLWVSDKHGFPIAVRMNMPGMMFTWEIRNLTEVADRGPEFFRPPSGVKIIEADPSQMMTAAGAFGGR